MTDSAWGEPEHTEIAADSASARNRIEYSQVAKVTEWVCKVGAMQPPTIRLSVWVDRCLFVQLGADCPLCRQIRSAAPWSEDPRRANGQISCVTGRRASAPPRRRQRSDSRLRAWRRSARGACSPSAG